MGCKAQRTLIRIIIGLFIISLCPILFAKEVNTYTEPVVEHSNPIPYNDLLPDSIRTIILSADSLKWILIDSWSDSCSTVLKSGEPIGEILLCNIVVDSIQNERIKDILTSHDSFQNDSDIKESTFIPDFGIIFSSADKTVIVSYSLYCDLCRFQWRDQILDLDGEAIRTRFIKCLREAFPKDKFVRDISTRL
jgi:hypothetical protein